VASGKSVLVTGSSGLIGSEAVVHYDREGWTVYGADNNMRMQFFGPGGDTRWNLRWLQEHTRSFHHVELDIRDRARVLQLFEERRFDLIVHCAAQPSHDLAARVPFDDWDVNAGGTFNLLEAARRCCPEAPFLFMSTNKVYGDAPNEVPLVELPTRFDYARPEDRNGIAETCRIDRCTHSLFGASKTAADVAAQEYGRYFGMPVGIFRGGCLTGSHHSGVELHGFLSYLVKVTVQGRGYKIYGYKGKQVRDNIHSADVIAAFDAFARNPRPGEVYNLGGGRQNSVSMLEAIAKIEDICGRKLSYEYVDQPRTGDHICYISDLTKLRSDFPEWRLTRSLDCILEEMVEAELARGAAPRSFVTLRAA
jgi:CDP-paratose 2-epimerase